MAKKSARPEPAASRPSREEAEDAVRVLLRWAGDDPAREGLIDTPARVVRAYEQFFAGYAVEPRDILARTFSEVDGYDEMIVLKDIRFESYCEHHMVPIIGRAHVAYLPNHRVVGISKLARLVDAFAKRLQIQEKMTVQIADTLFDVLQPKGRRRDPRSRAPVHLDARRAQAGRRDGHVTHARLIPHRSVDAARIPVDRRESFFRESDEYVMEQTKQAAHAPVVLVTGAARRPGAFAEYFARTAIAPRCITTGRPMPQAACDRRTRARFGCVAGRPVGCRADHRADRPVYALRAPRRTRQQCVGLLAGPFPELRPRGVRPGVGRQLPRADPAHARVLRTASGRHARCRRECGRPEDQGKLSPRPFQLYGRESRARQPHADARAVVRAGAARECGVPRADVAERRPDAGRLRAREPRIDAARASRTTSRARS